MKDMTGPIVHCVTIAIAKICMTEAKQKQTWMSNIVLYGCARWYSCLPMYDEYMVE